MREDRLGLALGAWALTALLCVALAVCFARAPRAGPSVARSAFEQRIDLNTADEPTLRLLPGIGPGLAKRIIDDRDANGPFTSVQDAARVPGIGPRTVAAFERHALTTAPEAHAPLHP